MHNLPWQYDFVHTASESVRAILDKIEEGNQSAMSRRSHVPQPTIGRIAKGVTVPDLENLEKIASAYGFDVWQLLVKGFDPKRPPVLRFMNGTEEALYLKFKEPRASLADLNGK